MSLFIDQSVCNQGILLCRSWELLSFQTAHRLSLFCTSLLLYRSLKKQKSLWFPFMQQPFVFLKTHSLSLLLCLSPILGADASCSFSFRFCTKSFQSQKQKAVSSSCDIIRCNPGPFLGDPVMHHVQHNADLVLKVSLETHTCWRRERTCMQIVTVHTEQLENSAK